MYYLDHNPPHFHVRYAGLKATVEIQTGRVISTELPSRAVRLVLEWHSQTKLSYLIYGNNLVAENL
jgi:hypothetical protein